MAEHTIRIFHNADDVRGFDPAEITITVGDTVIWRNDAHSTHTATSVEEDPLFDTGSLAPGQSSEPESFDSASPAEGLAYVCVFHDDMTGTIHVNN